MADIVAVSTAILALAVSIATAWLTDFHRGAVHMTVPSIVVFAYERAETRFVPKVMVRCLLVSTGERGHIIEALFARVKSGNSEHILPVWGVDADDKLVRGGGLLVDKRGVVAWHHFVAASDRPMPQFTPGTYEEQVSARIHEGRRPLRLWSHPLHVPEAAALSAHDGSEQVWFDRLPESDEFQARRESRKIIQQVNPSRRAGSAQPV